MVGSSQDWDDDRNLVFVRIYTFDSITEKKIDALIELAIKSSITRLINNNLMMWKRKGFSAISKKSSLFSCSYVSWNTYIS
ncbi:hypothetical protein [Gottfriedia acidiceleris]|uniref:hypothetical protein n=1 Tax=Gottfriedia acidiceleris TaxID=371036 RepID=UPI002FFDCB8D